jgi:hypothetical protein
MRYYSKVSLLILGLVLVQTSCKKKEKDCFDAELQERSKVIRCSSDCPGIIGCDGKTYCNECVAAQSGIRPE